MMVYFCGIATVSTFIGMAVDVASGQVGAFTAAFHFSCGYLAMATVHYIGERLR